MKHVKNLLVVAVLLGHYRDLRTWSPRASAADQHYWPEAVLRQQNIQDKWLHIRSEEESHRPHSARDPCRILVGWIMTQLWLRLNYLQQTTVWYIKLSNWKWTDELIECNFTSKISYLRNVHVPKWGKLRLILSIKSVSRIFKIAFLKLQQLKIKLTAI